jgi:hypothetical protein
MQPATQKAFSYDVRNEEEKEEDISSLSFENANYTLPTRS